MTAPAVALVVVAAGSGTRLGAPGGAKALVPVAGRSILERCIASALPIDEPVHVVVVAPSERIDECREAALAGGANPEALTVVVGGAERQDSVAAGLAALSDAIEVVLIHDAARLLTPGSVLERVIAAVREHGDAVVPVVPVVDTVRRMVDDAVLGDTVDRTRLAAVQTPQGFRRDLLERAYAIADEQFTDDAAVVAAAGGRVRRVPGDERAFKITTPGDLLRAEALVGAPGVRVGIGSDAHAFAEGRELWLGGLLWPGEVGLAGHSDGDTLTHAIVDAVLSASGAGDIGTVFGTDDPRVEGAHADAFLPIALELVAAAGFRVGNVSAQVIGNRPRIGPRRAELEAHLSALLHAPVSVSGTTTDGLGLTGEGRGIAAIVTCTLLPA